MTLYEGKGEKEHMKEKAPSPLLKANPPGHQQSTIYP